MALRASASLVRLYSSVFIELVISASILKSAAMNDRASLSAPTPRRATVTGPTRPPRSILRSLPPSASSKRFSLPETSSPPNGRPRFASINIPSAAFIDTGDDGDRLARACGMPPPSHYSDFPSPSGSPRSPSEQLEFTYPDWRGRSRKETADDARGRRRAKPMPRPDVKQVYKILDGVLRGMGVNMKEVLGLQDVLGMYEEDDDDDDEGGARGPKRVFGVSPLKSIQYASAPVVVGGYEARIPIVVHKCVEQLLKTGIYQPNLFRLLPSRERHLFLISVFDSNADLSPPSDSPATRRAEEGYSGRAEDYRSSSRREDRGSSSRREQANGPTRAGYGAAFSLAPERTEDVCALLLSYLGSLPGAVVGGAVGRALWEWCVARSGSGDAGAEAEVATLLLTLLPPPTLALFAYLMGFFETVAVGCGENGMWEGDVGRVFGAGVLGCKGGREEKWRGERMLVWMMRRWGAISEALFGGGEVEVRRRGSVQERRGPVRSPSRSQDKEVGVEKERPVRRRATVHGGGERERPGLARRAERRDGAAPYVSPKGGHRRLAMQDAYEFGAGREHEGDEATPRPVGGDGYPFPDAVRILRSSDPSAEVGEVPGLKRSVSTASSGSPFSEQGAEDVDGARACLGPHVVDDSGSVDRLLAERDKRITSLDEELESARSKIRDLEAKMATDKSRCPPPSCPQLDVNVPSEQDGLDWCDLLVTGGDEELRRRLDRVVGERDETRRVLREVIRLVEATARLG